MLTRTFSPASPAARPAKPHGHGGASSLLRMGLAAMPQRMAPAVRAAFERPAFLLQKRRASPQLSLFGPLGVPR